MSTFVDSSRAPGRISPKGFSAEALCLMMRKASNSMVLTDRRQV